MKRPPSDKPAKGPEPPEPSAARGRSTAAEPTGSKPTSTKSPGSKAAGSKAASSKAAGSRAASSKAGPGTLVEDAPPGAVARTVSRFAAVLDPEPGADGDRRRLLLRIGSGLVAVALVATLAVLVLGSRGTPRSAQTYCARMADTRDLGDVLAVGDGDQIVAAVHQLESAGKVAPAEIEPAMNTYVDYAGQLSDAVADAGKDEASIKAALGSALVAQNDKADDVAAAVTQVQAYVSTTCGFDLTQPPATPSS